MIDEEETPRETADRRGSAVRLAEALAAARSAAREAEADESTDDPTEPGVSAPIVATPDLPTRGATTGVRGDAEPEPAPTALYEDEPGDDTVGRAADTAEVVATADGGTDSAQEDPAAIGASRRRRMWPLHLIMGILIVAVPVLGYVGYRLTSDSTSGEILSGRAEPDSPGYLALVEPTPVALVMHTADDGTPRGLTILSLSGPDQRGGAIIAVPVRVRLDEPWFGITEFTGTIEANRPPTAAQVIGHQLGLGFTEAVRMTDTELAKFVEPVAPLVIENPEPVVTVEGETFEAGPLELSAEQVVAYLAATDEGNTLSGSLARQQLVWRTWVAAIADADASDAIPGETVVGLGHFLGGLAEGDVQTASFPVVPAEDAEDEQIFEVDTEPAQLLIANAVPFPVAAIPGDRATVALMNGTGPDPVPPSVIQRLTYTGAQIITMGNADSFDHDETSLTYSSSSDRAAAQHMATVLGVGRVSQSESADSGADIRIVMGTDLTSKPPEPLTANDVDTK